MDNITENFLELVDIEDVIETNEYVNMVDISVDEDESFLLSNGIISHNSAESGARKFRDPKTQGMFKLKGKFANTRKMTAKKMVETEEVSGLMSSLGLVLNEKINEDDLRFNEILITTDMDCIHEDTLIHTKRGNIKIKDVTTEDLVLTHTGNYKRIKRIVEQDKVSYIKIRLNNEDILFSENHKLIIFRDGEVLEILAKDIKYSDDILIKK